MQWLLTRSGPLKDFDCSLARSGTTIRGFTERRRWRAAGAAVAAAAAAGESSACITTKLDT